MAAGSDASTLIEKEASDILYVFDRRPGRASFEIAVNYSDVKTIKSFQQRLQQVCYAYYPALSLTSNVFFTWRENAKSFNSE